MLVRMPARCLSAARLGLLPLALCAGCTTMQTFPLDCVPRQVTIYVDGEQLDEIPDQLELRADQPHVVFFKGGGVEPRMIVLDTLAVDGGARLTPESVCLEPVFSPVERRLELEIGRDPEPGAEPGPDAGPEQR
jgi:hypothetical protein